VRRRSSARFYTTMLPQPYTCTAVIFLKELNAGRLNGGPNLLGGILSTPELAVDSF
jgi:hypothetical protein